MTQMVPPEIAATFIYVAGFVIFSIVNFSYANTHILIHPLTTKEALVAGYLSYLIFSLVLSVPLLDHQDPLKVASVAILGSSSLPILVVILYQSYMSRKRPENDFD